MFSSNSNLTGLNLFCCNRYNNASLLSSGKCHFYVAFASSWVENFIFGKISPNETPPFSLYIKGNLCPDSVSISVWIHCIQCSVLQMKSDTNEHSVSDINQYCLLLLFFLFHFAYYCFHYYYHNVMIVRRKGQNIPKSIPGNTVQFKFGLGQRICVFPNSHWLFGENKQSTTLLKLVLDTTSFSLLGVICFSGFLCLQ